MDDWAWEQLQPWLAARLELPDGPLFCAITGPTRGRRWSTAAARRRAPPGSRGGQRPSPLRAAPAPPRTRRRTRAPRRAPVVIQRQLGHSNLGITSVFLEDIDNAEIIETVQPRRAPMIPVSTSLRR
jgi:integrase/recombinase XerD